MAGVIEISADANRRAGKRGRSRAKLGNVKIPELFIDRSEVLIPQTDIQREIRFYLEIVLKVSSIAVRTNVVPGLRKIAGQRIERGIFLNRSVVTEIPEVSEIVLR